LFWLCSWHSKYHNSCSTTIGKSLGFIVIGIAGLACAVRLLNNWRHGLYIFFGWLFFEDFARKFVANNMVIYCAKDILVILFYISLRRAQLKASQKQ
jgi:hypothetical protein